MSKSIVVNLFGAPGAGKSTGAAYIFSKLKMNGVNAELITEFAKDKVWEKNSAALSNQAYMFGKQYYRISRCIDSVDVVITDSPLFLSILYNKDAVLGEDFNNMVINVTKNMRNMFYFVNRVKPYNPIGRLQTESESDALVGVLKELLSKNGLNCIDISGNVDGYDSVVLQVMNQLKFVGDDGETVKR